MSLYAKVGDRIRELRQAYAGNTGISQEDLGKALKVTANTVSRWETAAYKPSLNDLEKVARFFKIRIQELLPADQQKDAEPLLGLLRTLRQLHPDDVEELKRYADFRRMRSELKLNKKKLG